MQDDKELFISELYMKYAIRLENTGMRYVGYQALYHDLVNNCIQDTFLKAMEHYDFLKDYEYVEGWLYKAFMNRLRTGLATYRRRQKKRFSLDIDSLYSLSDPKQTAALEQVIMKIDNQALIEQLFSGLKGREYTVAAQFFLESRKVEEIASAQHTSVGAIRSALARIRAKAKEIAKNLHIFFSFFVLFLQVMRFMK